MNNSEYITNLKNYALSIPVGSISDFETHRKLFAAINGIIESFVPVMCGSNVSSGFEKGIFRVPDGQSSSPPEVLFLAQTAYGLNCFLDILKSHVIPSSIGSASDDNLISALSALLTYCRFLNNDSKKNLEMFIEQICQELQKRNFVFHIPEPIIIKGTGIYFKSKEYFSWGNPDNEHFETESSVHLSTKKPIISLYEDGVRTTDICLQTENDEDFTDKYYLIKVRVSLFGEDKVPCMQIDGFISDTPDKEKMGSDDIGYRVEGLFLLCGGKKSKELTDMKRGTDLVDKGLRYPGYTTPSNVRLIGFCPECNNSFAFHSYAFYMGQSDVAYSDDGTECYRIDEWDIDKEKWFHEQDGKTFRYYNSFSCPHCGAPYIDYKNNPDMKKFGVAGCVHLNHKTFSS